MAHGEKSEDGAGDVLGKLLGTLSIGLIFRHFVSGAVFIWAYCFSLGSFDHPRAFLASIKDLAGSLGIAALLIGTMIYALHRAITNPLLELIRHQLIARCPEPPENVPANRKRRFIMPPGVHEMMTQRWDAGEKFHPTPAHISNWGDYVHLGYTTSLALIFGSWTALYHAWKTNSTDHWGGGWEILLLFLIFLGSAFYSDCRRHLVEVRYYQKLKPEGEAKARAAEAKLNSEMAKAKAEEAKAKAEEAKAIIEVAKANRGSTRERKPGNRRRAT